MKSHYIFTIIAAIVLTSCGTSDNEAQTNNESRRYDELLSDKLNSYQALPVRADNPQNITSDSKIELGHILYFDTRLSKDGNISCNSCHNLDSYGVDNLPTSPCELGGNGGRNSPTTLNAALHNVQFWDGRAADVEEQAGGPVLNPVEMNIPSKSFLVERLKEVQVYQEIF